MARMVLNGEPEPIHAVHSWPWDNEGVYYCDVKDLHFAYQGGWRCVGCGAEVTEEEKHR